MNANGRRREDDAPSLSEASSSEQIPEYAEARRKKSKIFGVRQHARAAVYGAFDYEEKYPEDPIYAECSPTARVWRAYIEESQKFDVEVVEDWRDTIDVLLVFAGLFSAVVSTFAVEGYQNLQPDYQQLSTSLLIDLVTLQTNSTFEPSIPDLDAFSPTLQNIWVNGLWFTSLTMSLITALISGLIKQWLHHYTIIPSGTPRERSCIRQYRYRGLQLWHVPIIIGLLPVLMHLALALFFIGLALFLIQIHAPIAWFIISVGAIVYVAYIMVTLLPLRFPQCPYQTPLGSLIHASFFYAQELLLPVNHPGLYFKSLREIELDMVRSIVPTLCIDALYWFYTLSSNTSVRSIVIQAIGGLPMSSIEDVRAKFQNSDILADHADLTKSCLATSRFDDIVSPAPGEESKLERLLRFELVLPPKVVHAPLVPILKLPETANVNLTAVALTSHFRTHLLSPYWSARSMELLISVLLKKMDVRLPPMVWASLITRAADINVRSLEQNVDSWVMMCGSLLDASTQSWSVRQAPTLSGAPDAMLIRQSVNVYLYDVVVEAMLRAYTQTGFNPVSRDTLIRPRIQLLVSVINFLLLRSPLGVDADTTPTFPVLLLFLHTTQELERCIAYCPDLNVVETHAIFNALERILQSRVFASGSSDLDVWTARICVLETYTILLGIPARLRNGFLPMTLRIAPSSPALVPLQQLIEVVFNDKEWRHPPASSTFFEGALYAYFQTLCKFLRQSFKVHIAVVYEAFRAAGGLKLGHDCLCHPLFGALVEGYVVGVVAPSTTLVRSVVYNQLDYLFDEVGTSENLLNACVALGVRVGVGAGARDALVGLVRCRDEGVWDGGVWEGCLVGMRGIVDSDGPESDGWFEKQRVRVGGEVDVEEVKEGVRQALLVLQSGRGTPVQEANGVSVERRGKC